MPLLARAAKLFTCYKARCQDDRGVWRLYFGLTRVDAAQTAEGAVHRSSPHTHKKHEDNLENMEQ